MKHAYLDFTYPDTEIKVQAGLQYVALPSVFGNPVFDDDAAAITVSGKINDVFGVTVGYTRGVDGVSNFNDDLAVDGVDQDDIDVAMLVVPVELKEFNFKITPYFAYAWLGANVIGLEDNADAWVFGANAVLNMYDPLTFAADLIYGELDADDYESKGWYAALAATYKFDAVTATLFTTYATGADEDADEDDFLPTLAEGWGISPYVGGVRAFSTSYDSFGTNAVGVGSDGRGVWTLGLVLDDISFVEKLSHTLVIAYGRGTSDEDAAYATIDASGNIDERLAFTEDDDLWEIYLVNKYMIYENLAAINELGYFKANSEFYEDVLDRDLDASYFATLGLQYKF